MAKISAPDGVKLYVETVGSGTPVVFVHEYAGDYRSWEAQVRYFCRQHRCVTYSQRGYPPSEVPSDPGRYSQDVARDDVIAVMDGLGIDQFAVVGKDDRTRISEEMAIGKRFRETFGQRNLPGLL